METEHRIVRSVCAAKEDSDKTVDLIITNWETFLETAPEETFAQRNFGNDFRQRYKPDCKKHSDENADIRLRYADDAFDSNVPLWMRL